jgi:hypothetical protein
MWGRRESSCEVGAKILRSGAHFFKSPHEVETTPGQSRGRGATARPVKANVVSPTCRRHHRTDGLPHAKPVACTTAAVRVRRLMAESGCMRAAAVRRDDANAAFGQRQSGTQEAAVDPWPTIRCWGLIAAARDYVMTTTIGRPRSITLPTSECGDAIQSGRSLTLRRLEPWRRSRHAEEARSPFSES